MLIAKDVYPLFSMVNQKEQPMSTEANKEIIRRYLDAISGKPKTEAVLGLFIAEQPLIDHIMVCEDAFPLYDLTPTK
jgi:hypothetical protein